MSETTTESASTKIALLDDGAFPAWHTKIQALPMQNKHWSYVLGNSKNQQRQQRLRNALRKPKKPVLQRVHSIGYKDPQGLYQELITIYGTSGFSGRYYTFRQLFNLQLGDGSCSDYIPEINNLSQALNDAIRTLHPVFLIAIISNGLPSRYHAVITGKTNSVCTKDNTATADVKLLVNALLDEQKHLIQDQGRAAALGANPVIGGGKTGTQWSVKSLDFLSNDLLKMILCQGTRRSLGLYS
ncbi:hypothetical protein FPQ18DRAFT_387418 [Pyronema domesticum]|nr:hypothetical protein FPQ18DRAFT_387418 [Pyronema domesticum]